MIIFDASQGLFPHRLASDEEDERRVFHVALTRARSQVVALAPAEAPSMFLAELDGSRFRSDTRAAAPRPSRSVTSKQGPGRPGRNGRGKGSAVFADVGLPVAQATIGLPVEYRGSSGTIVEIGAQAAVLSLGAVTTKVAFGSDVRVDGQTVTLVAPAAVRAAAGAAEATLRAWRSATASREAVPAYVILKDTELAGIAARAPGTLAELAACPGMGPIRLERWGDEILATLDAAGQPEEVPSAG